MVNLSNWTRRLGKAPMGFIGMVLLVAMVEHAIDSRGNLFTELMPATWKYSASKARKEGKHARILCFGSSLVKFGVLPKVLREETGEPTYNLAVYGGRMASSYVLLKQAIDAGAKPRAIVLDCHDGPVAPDKLDERAEALATNLRNWPELLRPRDLLEIAWEARDGQFVGSAILAKLLPSVRSRNEIRGEIVKGCEGKTVEVNPNLVAALRNWNTNLGTQVMTPVAPAVAAPAEDLVETHPDVLKRGDWRANPLLDRSLEKLLKLTRANGIQVYLILPPLSPGVHVNQDAQGQTVFCNDVCRKALDLDPKLVVIDGRRSGYGWPEFNDTTHLNADGALTFSREIGKVIASGRGGSSENRWVKLPRYQKSVDTVGIETFEQSRGVVGLFDKVRR